MMMMMMMMLLLMMIDLLNENRCLSLKCHVRKHAICTKGRSTSTNGTLGVARSVRDALRRGVILKLFDHIKCGEGSGRGYAPSPQKMLFRPEIV